MSLRMKHLFLIPCLFLFTIGTLFAGDLTFHNRISYSKYGNIPVQIGNPEASASIAVTSGVGLYSDLNIRNFLTLGIDHDLAEFQGDAFDQLEVDVQITPYTNGTAGAIYTRTLTIEYHPFDKESYKDKDIYRFLNVDEFDFEITAIRKFVGTVLTNETELPKNVFLDGDIIVNRIGDFSAKSTTPIDLTSPIGIDYNCDGVIDQLRIQWNTLSEAAEYQLEWTFINNYNGNITNGQFETLLNSQLEGYNFRSNSTRVSTTNNYYEIPYIFEKGIILWRVRGVGYNPLNTTQPIFGVWSNDPAEGDVQSFVNNNSFGYIYNQTPHEVNKNWQITTTFAEEGKKKEVISYYDGSLRNRQSVTVVNTDNNVIVGQTIYDHQGRPAINVLPVPVVTPNCSVNGADTSKSVIKYYPNFNVDYTGKIYAQNDFDLDVSNCETATPPMLNDSGASRYYSNKNPNQKDHQAYVPNAEGYPFTQVEYTPDNTGRIRRQSGVGTDFQLGTDHESKYYYGKALQINLDRLFGTEVGYATHYKKNLVVDPNGQVNITYLDQEGRTVATSLAGEAPDNLSEIESLKILNNQGGVTLTADLFEKDPNGKSMNNILDVTGNSISFNQELLVSTEGLHTFTYNLSKDAYSEACTPNICYNCVYDLKLTLTDECGALVNDFNTGEPVEFIAQRGYFTVNNGITTFKPDCENGGVYDTTYQFQTLLKVGNYTINKTLTLNNDIIAQAFDTYLAEGEESGCVDSLGKFIEDAIANANTSGCNVTCQECLDNLGTIEDFVSQGQGSAAEYQALKEDCDRLCGIAPTFCETMFEILKADMSPEGQYGKYLLNGVVSTQSFPLSVYNASNLLPYNSSNTPTENWREPSVTINGNTYDYYLDENGDSAKVFLTVFGSGSNITTSPAVLFANGTAFDDVYFDPNTGVYYTYPNRLANVADFINLFEESWAQSLVVYHPEYCYYENCISLAIKNNDDKSSEEFDALLRATNSFNEALSKGLIIEISTNVYAVKDFSNNSTYPYDPYVVGSTQSPYGNQLTQVVNTYQTINTVTYTMSEAAAIMSRCGNNIIGGNTTALNTCASNLFTGTDAQKDEDWIRFVGLYLSKKKEIQNQELKASGLCSTNDCIGNSSFDPVASGIWQSSFNYLNNPYFNDDNPCSIYRKNLYNNKIKRFSFGSDLVEQANSNNGAYQTYVQTGQCPKATYLQGLLNEITADGKLTTNANDLFAYNNLGTLYFDPNNIQPVLHRTWDILTNTSTTLSVEITEPINNEICPFELNALTPIVWNDIVSFSELTATTNGGFIIKAKLANGTSVELTGSTCLDLTNCIFDKVCEPNNLSESFIDIINTLNQENRFNFANPYTLPVSPYQGVFTPSFLNLLGETSIGNITWQFNSIVGSGTLGVFSNGTQNVEVILVNSAPNNFTSWNAISHFTNLQYLNNNQISIDVIDQFSTPVATLTIELKTGLNGQPANAIVNLGACEFPLPLGCDQHEHEVLRDLTNLLKDVFVNNAPNNYNVYQSVAATNTLNNYFGGGTNATGTESTIPISGIDHQQLKIVTRNVNNQRFCTLTFLFPSQNNYSYDNIVEIISVKPSGELINDAYYGYKIEAVFEGIIANVFDTITISGTSCLPLLPCFECVPGVDTVISTIDVSCLSFDGVNDVVVAGTDSRGITDEITVEAWVKTPSVPGVGATILSKTIYTNNNTASEGLKFCMSSGGLPLLFFQSQTAGSTQVIGNAPIIDNQWHHLVGTINNNDEWTLYVDGTIQGTTTFTLPNLGNNGPLEIGGEQILNYYYQGLIKNVVFYNRAITAAEVTANYNQGKPNALTPNIVGYFPLNEGNGQVIQDISSLAIDGTLGATNATASDDPSWVICDIINDTAYIEKQLKDTLITSLSTNELSFDGLDDFAQFGNSDRTLTTTATFQTWVKTTNTFNFPLGIISKYDGISNQGHSLYIQNGKLFFQVINQSNINQTQQTTQSVNDGEWHHVAVTINASNQYAIYIDGQLDFTQQFTGGLLSLTADGERYLGRFNDGGFYQGELKHTSIWSIAKSSQDIANDYANEHPTGTEPNLVGYFPLNEGSGQTLNDLSSTALNGFRGFDLDNNASDPSWIINTTYDTAIIDKPCVDTNNFVFEALDIEVDTTDPCIEQAINIATLNAQIAYQQYIDSLATAFTQNMRAHCLSPTEDLTMEFNEKEYHYTLYYYDQAGNLVKTIPPEGVEILNTNASTDVISQAIAKDRLNNTQSVFTSHRLETKYKYNSLNQLTHQKLPDHDGMDVFEFSKVEGLDPNLIVTAVQFITETKGYLTGILPATLNDKGLVYTTNDGGQTWQKVNHTLGTNLKAVQWANDQVAYAVGSEGILIKTTNAGFTWCMLNTYTAGVTALLNDLVVVSPTQGCAVGDNGTIISFDNDVVTKITPNITNSSEQITANDNITAIEKFTFGSPPYPTFITVNNTTTGRGRFYTVDDLTSPTGTWTQLNDNRLSFIADIQALNSTNYFAAGANGILIHSSDGGANWNMLKPDSKLSYKAIHFSSTTEGVSIKSDGSLYATNDGGLTWTILDNTKTYNGFYPISSDRVLAFGNSGALARVIMNTGTSFGIIPYTNVPNANFNSGWFGNLTNNSTIILTDGIQIYYTFTADDYATNWTTNATSTPFPKEVEAVTVGNDVRGVIRGAGIGNSYAFEFIGGVYNELPITNIDISALEKSFSNQNIYMHDVSSGYIYTANASAFIPNNPVQTNFNTNLTQPLIDFDNHTDDFRFVFASINGKITNNTAQPFQPAVDQTNNVRSLPLNKIGVIDGTYHLIGDNGTLIRKENTECIIIPTEDIEDYNALTSNVNNSVLVGDNGLVRVFDDVSSTSSVKLNTNTTADILDVSVALFTSTDAYYGTSSGVLYKTNDITNPTPDFVAINSNSANPIHGVDVSPNGTVIYVGDESRIYRGNTASAYEIKNTYTPALTDVHFSSILHGHVTGLDYTVRQTNDGGLTWKTILPSNNFTNGVPDVKGVHTFGAGDAMLVGDAGYVALVNNQLATPNASFTGNTDFQDIEFIDNNKGILVGGNTSAKAYLTNDKGTNWAALSFPSGMDQLNSVYGFNNNSYVAVGKTGTIAYVNASGSVSDISSAVTTEDLYDVHFYDNLTGYIVGANGTLLKSAFTTLNPLTQEITGISWNIKPTTDSYNPNPKDIFTVDFATPYSGFVGGAHTTGSLNYARIIKDESDEFSTYFWYDRLSRVAVSQNSKQFNAPVKRYSYTLYDQLGRVIEAGEKEENTNVTNPFKGIFGSYVGGLFNPKTVDDTKLQAWLNDTTGKRIEVTRSYYDLPANELGITLPAGFTQNKSNMRKRIAAISYEKEYDYGTGSQNTYSYATFYDYDIHGNVKTLIQDNKELGNHSNPAIAALQYKRMDYDYDLISGNVHQVAYQNGKADAWYHKYTYDGDNRIQETYTSDNGVMWDREAKYIYYDHGPLARVEVGEHNIQGSDYVYTLQGWLKGVNSDLLNPNNDPGLDALNNGTNPNALFARDAMGFSLRYRENDYSPIDYVNKWQQEGDRFASFYASTSDAFNARENLYNGNIAGMVTTITKPQLYTSTGNEMPEIRPQATAYVYDQLNRISQARAFQNIETDVTNAAYNVWGTTGTAYDNLYYNAFTYDASGNILTQIRHDDKGYKIEDLVYHYGDQNGKRLQNRLYSVSDFTGQFEEKLHGDDIEDMGFTNPGFENLNSGNENYKYDPIGQLIQNKQEEIAEIRWRVDNKIRAIIRQAGSDARNVIFDYDPMGNRIAKHTYSNEAFPEGSTTLFDPTNPIGWLKTTYYRRDAQGNVMAVYDYALDTANQTSTFKLVERNIYGSSRIGLNKQEVEMIDAPPMDTTMLTHTIGNKQYELNNHLGNVLSVVTDRKFARDTNQDGTIDYFEPEIIKSTDYSPFGVELYDRNFVRDSMNFIRTYIKDTCLFSDDYSTLLSGDVYNVDDGVYGTRWNHGKGDGDVTPNGQYLVQAKEKNNGGYQLMCDFSLQGLIEVGKAYRLSFDIDSMQDYIDVRWPDASQTIFGPPDGGTSKSYEWIAAGPNEKLKFKDMNMPIDLKLYIKNMKLVRIDTVNEQNVVLASQYRYGFQSQEHDNEVLDYVYEYTACDTVQDTTTLTTLAFDGTGDYVNAGISNRGITTAFTIGAWVRTTTNQAFKTIVSKFDVPNNKGYKLCVNGDKVFFIGLDGNQINATPVATTSITDGNWHYVSVSVHGNNQYDLYMDGQLEVSQVFTGNPIDFTNNGETRIGYLNFDGYFTGDIRDVSIWNRAKSSSEITYDYKREIPNVTDNGLVAYFPLNEGTGTVANDLSVTGINGSISGATWNTEEVIDTLFVGTDSIRVPNRASVAFKYRQHNPLTGRLEYSIDPLYRDYPWNSPYAFSENRVIDGLEFEGLERISAHAIINRKVDGVLKPKFVFLSIDFNKSEARYSTISYYKGEATGISTVYNFKRNYVKEDIVTSDIPDVNAIRKDGIKIDAAARVFIGLTVGKLLREFFSENPRFFGISNMEEVHSKSIEVLNVLDNVIKSDLVSIKKATTPPDEIKTIENEDGTLRNKEFTSNGLYIIDITKPVVSTDKNGDGILIKDLQIQYLDQSEKTTTNDNED